MLKLRGVGKNIEGGARVPAGFHRSFLAFSWPQGSNASEPRGKNMLSPSHSIVKWRGWGVHTPLLDTQPKVVHSAVIAELGVFKASSCQYTPSLPVSDELEIWDLICLHTGMLQEGKCSKKASCTSYKALPTLLVDSFAIKGVFGVFLPLPGVVPSKPAPTPVASHLLLSTVASDMITERHLFWGQLLRIKDAESCRQKN